jgi:hypothetical protein
MLRYTHQQPHQKVGFKLIQLILFIQLTFSAIYYLTAPFSLSALIVLFWLINSLSVILLLKSAHEIVGELNPSLKLYRLMFTASLLISEIVINIISDSYQADNIHGFISDIEVLFTGITLGVLWYYEITRKLKKIF